MNNFKMIRNLIKSIESLDFKAENNVEWAGAYLQNNDFGDLVLENSVLWYNLKKYIDDLEQEYGNCLAILGNESDDVNLEKELKEKFSND